MGVQAKCPWCGSQAKPDVQRSRNPDTGKLITKYGCLSCNGPWDLDDSGTPQKL